ncbi:MAG: hypothetical protein A2289_07860 [Deltaproteobacteria bacterium RIFOXYA12_FULL_58_15]|nr:MAG: hypothetical protein A2289_07860 [Deltaproteobacteria bacterium RIFOXYA12_FULL_58_15]
MYLIVASHRHTVDAQRRRRCGGHHILIAPTIAAMIAIMAAIVTAQVGMPAPDFEIQAIGPSPTELQTTSLGTHGGRWLLLMFYPRDFSFVCPAELAAFSTRFDDFTDRECDVLAVSVDSVESHQAWLAAPAIEGGVAGLRFPLGSDPNGDVASRYGVFVDSAKVAGRGLFLIDPNRVLQYAVVHNLNIGRNADEILRVIDALRAGGLCGPGWTRADGTIDPRLDLRKGRVLDHYRVEELLGEGGFGWVYSAYDLLLDRTVAIKIGRTTSRDTRRAALREAKSVAKLSHPNICTIFAVADAAGVPLIVMEYLPGKSLTEQLAGQPPRSTTLRIAREIVAGLAASHAAGVVHGDVKPANIMFDNEGVAKVADFGMARRVSYDDGTQPVPTGIIGGTPAYMAPEQTTGSPPSTATDVFGTGLLLYEVFTGKRAIVTSSPTEALNRVRQLDANGLANDVPEPFRNVFARMLAQDPSERPTMSAVQSAIASLQP